MHVGLDDVTGDERLTPKWTVPKKDHDIIGYRTRVLNKRCEKRMREEMLKKQQAEGM